MAAPTGHLALKDIAELAQVSRPAVSNWRRRFGDFPEPVEESTSRKPLFEAAAVVEWLKRNGFFPEGAESELQLINLLAIANLLRNEITVDGIPLVMLTLLALNKDPEFEPSAEFDELKSQLSAELLQEVQNGIARLNLDDYREAARQIVDRFLGIGARGMRSQYGTTSSLSSAAVVAAASTTAEGAATVLDPACGIAGTLLGVGEHAPQAQLLGVDMDLSAASLAQVFAYLTGRDAHIVAGDSLADDPFADVKADLIVCEPPLGMYPPRQDDSALRGASSRVMSARRSSGPQGAAEELFLLYAAERLTAGGRAYIMTGTSVTYRERFKDHRQRLVAEGRVEAVVELPSGVFSATRLPAALWVLSAEKVAEPLLIDASGQTQKSVPLRIADWLTAARRGEVSEVPYKAVSLADLITNDGSLHPSSYLTEPLSHDEAGVAYDTALRAFELSAEGCKNIGTSVIAADAVPVPTEYITFDELLQSGHFTTVTSRFRPEQKLESGKARLVGFRRYRGEQVFVDDFDAEDVVRPGDIVVPRNSESDAWVCEDDGETWVLSMHATVFRPTSDEYDPHFIAACINAPVNIDTRGQFAHRASPRRLAIPKLDHQQQAVIGDVYRALSQARSAADRLDHGAQQLGAALLNLVFADK